jgi:quinol monooxygenase YgiN
MQWTNNSIERVAKNAPLTAVLAKRNGALPMITIKKGTGVVTLINVFTVEPAKQLELISLLTRATDLSVRHVAGFISASLHRSLDGTKVTMYAQWRSIEDYQAMRQNPVVAPYLQQALSIAKFDPGMYEVAETFVSNEERG